MESAEISHRRFIKRRNGGILRESKIEGLGSAGNNHCIL